MKKKLILAFFVLVAILNLVGNYLELPDLVKFTKPALMPILLYYVLESASGKVTSQILLLSVAIIFSWGGDLALMGNEDLFLLGVGLFFIAQISYIVLFYRSVNGPFHFRFTPIVPYLAYGAIFLYMILPNTGALQVPVLIYALSLVGMTSFARLRQGITSAASFNYTAMGAVLFLISDSILAMNKFANPIPMERIWVMLTYISAQFLIAKGILEHQDQSE